MSNPLRDLPHYLHTFRTYLGRRMYIVFVLSTVAALAEGVGILMLLPLLQGLEGPAGIVNKTDGAENGITGKFLDLLSIFGWTGSTVAILLFITAAIAIKGLLTFGAMGYNAYLQGKLLRELKGRLFDGYSDMSYGYYASHDTGHFVNVINNQTNQMLAAFRALTKLGSKLVAALVYLVLGFAANWHFGVMVLGLGIVLLLLFRWLNTYVRDLSRKTAMEQGHLAKLLIQTLHAYKYLTATAQLPKLRHYIVGSIRRLTAYEMRRGISEAFTAAAGEPVAVVLIMLLVLVQIIFLEQALAPILVSIVLFYRCLSSVMSMQGGLQGSLDKIGSLEIVRDEFESLGRNMELDGDHRMQRLAQGIRFSDVCFSYDSSLGDVIKNVSLDIPARTSIALVGASGSGKSTLVDLLTLVLKPRQGEITIDSVPAEVIQRASWRQQIGYVSQETVIFNDTIANNICLWEGEICSDTMLFKRVENAARQAHICQYIETLPDGYQTVVGDRGLRLSGGQRQRLFIARELFRQPSLLILDEATSALDSESERAIQKSIDELQGQVTVVIIAHRLSTIRNVDQVYVFDKGRLIEQGPYLELRDAKNSRFGQLLSMQDM